MTEVILKEDVEKLGEAGEVVDVKPGYARNYLLPQGLALPATESNLRRLEEERRHTREVERRKREQAEETARGLREMSLTFQVRAGEGGKLFGSVTSDDIASRLAEEGLKIDRRVLQLPEPIRELGVYDVEVDLDHEVEAAVKVWVVAEE